MLVGDDAEVFGSISHGTYECFFVFLIEKKIFSSVLLMLIHFVKLTDLGQLISVIMVKKYRRNFQKIIT